jgi:hypothetical protein
LHAFFSLQQSGAEARTPPHVLFTRWITAQNKPLGGRNSCTANYRLQVASYWLDTPKNALFSLSLRRLFICVGCGMLLEPHKYQQLKTETKTNRTVLKTFYF